MKKRYLIPGDYMADPSVHVFEGKVYIYLTIGRAVFPKMIGEHILICATIMFSRWKM
mgnify:CR=1 FL=1